ncbi:MAG: SLBB domain-containing protein [Cyanobacteria bacterium P01_H01_bin.58]
MTFPNLNFYQLWMSSFSSSIVFGIFVGLPFTVVAQPSAIPVLPGDPERSFPEADQPVFPPRVEAVDIPPARDFEATEVYLLGPGDQVQMEVFRVPDYSGNYEVGIDGTLNLPMIGQVLVEGLTLTQAQQKISKAYGTRLRRPIVDLVLLTPRPLRVGVTGEVASPGAYTLVRQGTQFPSLIQALEVAGGITQSADLRRIAIARPRGNGNQQTLTADLWAFLQTGAPEANVTLRDGDTIFVPTQENFNREESLQLAAVNFAADDAQPLNIAVIGEVFRPGPYTVTGTARTGDAGIPGGSGSTNIAPTVTRAIQVAGGIKPAANIREIQVYRRTRNGQEQTITVNLWNLLSEGVITEDIVLQESDTVYVPKAEALSREEISEIAAASFSPNTIRINVVGEVSQPGVVEVSPNTPLSQGVLAAGGFDNRRARTTAVELIRLNPDGTVTRETIEIDFAAGLDEENNPLLQNNDIIVVKRSTSATLADTLDTLVIPLGRVISLFTIPTRVFDVFD